MDTIIADYDNGDYKTYLLHGVTGSGKTEVYLEAIEHVLNKGRQVIVLIPEIALTFQTVQRFYHRFGDKVSIMNSRMSKGERYDQFLRAQRGDISVMIGPRSALFTPFSNIGLIVIDEEHEGAYKSETVPRYHAREVACHIAKEAGASVILGSATPSMESYYAAMNGHIELIKLGSRAGSGKLPAVDIVDLREELRLGNRTIFSNRLRELMSERLAKHEQIMLFLNKRGVAGFISCRSCGKVMKCPHCDVSLTEHADGRLMCHYCGYTTPKITACPSCGSRYVSGFRAGTEGVEAQVKKTFPQARVLRMDMDTTRGKDGHEKILSEFANGNADILIGTQMIVKGHDFPNVTLMGVLAADMSLYASDYRASERTFQLLTQAAGRAGRAEKSGNVVIQTYTPEHFSIVSAANQDYNAFYEQEIAYRKLCGYPPADNLMKIMLSSSDEMLLTKSAAWVKAFVDNSCKAKGLMCIGPADAPIYKIKDVYSKIMDNCEEDYMAIRNIRTLGDDILRAKAKEITEMTPRIEELIDDMFETMYEANGVGLAAPQVGIRKRLVVIDCGDDPIVLINPVVLETSGSQTGLEGCLSVPGKTGEVTRPNYAKVKALNENMEEIIVEGEELLARCLLHEIDHLDGIMYVDKVEGELLSTDDIEEE